MVVIILAALSTIITAFSVLHYQLSDIKIGLKKQKRSTIPAQFVPTYLIQG